jgi:hypothetical protein
MTRQPAVDVRLLLSVTGDAESHLKGHPLEPIHGLDLAVALFTNDFFLDVSFVVKKNMLRDVIYFDPWRRHLSIKILMLLLDFRVANNDVLVTVKAFFYRRDAGEMGTTHIGMAELALDLLHPGMHMMAERDRLLRSQVPTGHPVEAIKKRKDQSQRDEA